VFKPFDEVWNPGFMPLDMVFKNVNKSNTNIMGQPMGPDRPMGPSPMGPSPMAQPSGSGPSPMAQPSGSPPTAGGDSVNLVLIYAPWCGHSKRMLPDYERLKSEFDGKNINGKNINISMYTDEDKDKVKEYGVKGFPSLFIEKDGNRESFPHRTYEKMSDYLNSL
jgi:thiol-disulfide isomerase/thioredoxin